MKEHPAHSPKPADPASQDQKIFLLIFIATVIITLVLVFGPKQGASQPLTARAAFAECLSAKGVTMYGEDTCPNCQTQKGMFEEDFARINYVNCYIHKDVCDKMGVQGYPMWMYNGQSLPGVQTFQKLAQFSSCQAP